MIQQNQKKNHLQKGAESGVALVTGASRGIGKVIARGLAGMGYQVVVTGRNRSDLERVAEEIKRNGGLSPIVFPLDITDERQLKEMAVLLKEDLGRIDILVNNAGIHFSGTLELSPADFRSMIDTNLTAQFMVLKYVVPIMKEQGKVPVISLMLPPDRGKQPFRGQEAIVLPNSGL